jgi:undecaprenyl phosphate-alpha-L-ara4FN deformylase
VKGRDWSVLTLHAEMEGIGYREMAGKLLTGLLEDGVTCVPLETLAKQVQAEGAGQVPVAEVVLRPIRGRAGTVAMPANFEVA